MRRMRADAWIAVVLLLACGFLLQDLLATEGSGAFVKTTTLPTALVVVIALLSVILLGSSLRAAGQPSSGPDKPSASAAGLLRVAAMVVWTAAFVAALPWLGYLLASGLFLVGANLLYGNRNPIPIVAISVAVPTCLYLFFEKFMIVLLPSSRLFG